MMGWLRKYCGPFSGMTAHLLQRVTGVLLLLYLFLHVETVAYMSHGPAAFNQAVGRFQTPLFKVLEISLLGAVVAHALNGVRITLLDWGAARGRQRRMFWWLTVGVGTLLFLAGAIPMFWFAVIGR